MLFILSYTLSAQESACIVEHPDLGLPRTCFTFSLEYCRFLAGAFFEGFSCANLNETFDGIRDCCGAKGECQTIYGKDTLSAQAVCYALFSGISHGMALIISFLIVESNGCQRDCSAFGCCLGDGQCKDSSRGYDEARCLAEGGFPKNESCLSQWCRPLGIFSLIIHNR